MAIDRTSHGTWRARWRDPDGRQRAKSFARKVDAERFHRDITAAIDHGTYVPPAAGKVSVGQAADEWLAGARNLTRSSADTYRRDLDRHVLPTFGALPLVAVTPALVDRWLTRQSATYAATSVLRQYRTLSRLLAVAVARGHLARNPCALVTPPRLPPAEMRFLSVDEVDAITDAIAPRYRALVQVAAWGGLRWSELVGLRRARVDGATVHVVEQLLRAPDGEWYRQQPKTRAGVRHVVLPGSVAGMLAAHLDEYAHPTADGLVFPNGRGAPLIASSWGQSVWRPALARAGVGPTRPHDLRHTAVAFAIAAGAHPKVIQARMGHASITVTLDRYGHLLPALADTLAGDLDALRLG